MSDAMELTTDPWDHWRRRVAGERVAVFEGEPQWGYYRLTKKTDQPVAIFDHYGALTALVGPVDSPQFTNPAEIWTRLTPISQEVYDATARDGQSFTRAALNKTVARTECNSDGRAWREAKARIIEAAAAGKGVRLTAKEALEAAAELGERHE